MDAFSYRFFSLRNNHIVHIILLDCIHMRTNDCILQKLNSFKQIKFSFDRETWQEKDSTADYGK